MKNLDKFKKKVDAAEKIYYHSSKSPNGDALGATKRIVLFAEKLW
jgi:hypothetical protein